MEAGLERRLSDFKPAIMFLIIHPPCPADAGWTQESGLCALRRLMTASRTQDRGWRCPAQGPPTGFLHLKDWVRSLHEESPVFSTVSATRRVQIPASPPVLLQSNQCKSQSCSWTTMSQKCHTHIFTPFPQVVPREGTPGGCPSPALINSYWAFKVLLCHLPCTIPGESLDTPWTSPHILAHLVHPSSSLPSTWKHLYTCVHLPLQLKS